MFIVPMAHLGELYSALVHTKVLFLLKFLQWYPCFEFLVTSLLAARVGSALFTFVGRGKCNVHPKIHLWCYIYRPLGNQQCSWTLSHCKVI